MKDKKTKYILRLPNKMLKSFSGEEVQNLLDMGAFHQKDWVFIEETREWLRPFDMTGVWSLPELSDELEFEMPAFSPPPAPKKTYSEEEYEELESQLHKIQHDYNNKLAVIEALKSTREDLEEDFQKIASEKSELVSIVESVRQEETIARTDLVNANLEIDNLNNQISNLEQQVHDLLEMKDELFSLKSNLAQQQEELKEEIVRKELSFASFEAENKSLEARVQELLEENEKLKKKQLIYRDYVKNEKMRADNFEEDISKLNEGIVKLRNLRKKDKITIQNLENYKQTQANKEARELNRLIGDSFEIDNSPHWFIEMDGEVKGPFRYHDMRSMLRFEKINNDTPVKKQLEPFWRSLDQDFELTANIITHSEVIDGEEVFRYFVNRGDYRAPFHGAAIIEIDGQEFTGFCTSLSSGGAFIELPDLPENLEQGGVANLRISEGTLSQDLVAPVFMRNFSYEKPCGIGLQFQGLNDEQQNAIISYVSSYLENIKKTA